ncbi:hypothetical protein [Pseudomonas canadensis]|uniref:hypothetical protein n=1 Tax=Pseudomonas canadensis TaxID=915099 RepID=UPI003B9FE5DC
MVINLGKGRFILDSEEDTCAQAAMEAYADACSQDDPNLAEDIRQKLGVGYGSLVCLETARRVLAVAHLTESMKKSYSKAAWDEVYSALTLLER